MTSKEQNASKKLLIIAPTRLIDCWLGTVRFKDTPQRLTSIGIVVPSPFAQVHTYERAWQWRWRRVARQGVYRTSKQASSLNLASQKRIAKPFYWFLIRDAWLLLTAGLWFHIWALYYIIIAKYPRGLHFCPFALLSSKKTSSSC